MSDVNVKTALARILLNHRRTLQQNTAKFSWELLLGHRIRSRLSTSFLPLSSVSPQDNQSWNFAPGDDVHARNYGITEKWTPGRVKSTSGVHMVTSYSYSCGPAICLPGAGMRTSSGPGAEWHTGASVTCSSFSEEHCGLGSATTVTSRLSLADTANERKFIASFNKSPKARG